MQYLGRRSTLIGVSIPFILGFILMGLSYHVVSLVPLYIGRALTGLMNGASLPAAQIYVIHKQKYFISKF
jgi:facilitated trehalose transporter